VRTDPDVPKHRGISYFAFPMQQDGVEVRPLRQMNQRSSFNEVFLSDARVPHANLVGELHRGWPVALTTLAHERGLAGAIFGALPPTTDGRTAREAMAEARDYLKTYEWYPQRAGRADLVPSAARDAARNYEPILRQQIAHLHTLESVARWTAQRARAAHRQGRPPGPEGSIAKLCGSEIARHANRAHTQIAGAAGMLNRQDGPGPNGVIAEVLVSTPAQSIAGGTDEIQHNIIGERVLGLPKEPPINANVAYRHLRANG
jgi:alkylation response protein AidB-like acyl-CoA dehydrogenase